MDTDTEGQPAKSAPSFEYLSTIKVFPLIPHLKQDVMVSGCSYSCQLSELRAKFRNLTLGKHWSVCLEIWLVVISSDSDGLFA